jgi:curved DNA-binding protein CbpA
MVMAAAEQDGTPAPDPYQLLGVARGASGEEITRAWRRRAAAEHPDHRPRDAAAPARFRALTEAYQVLGDPARRAAYDRSLGNQPRAGAAAAEGPAAGLSARSQRGPGVPVTVRRAGRVPEPPLRAGPVWVEIPPPVPAAGPRTAEDYAVRLAALAELAARYLADDGGWPW